MCLSQSFQSDNQGQKMLGGCSRVTSAIREMGVPKMVLGLSSSPRLSAFTKHDLLS